MSRFDDFANFRNVPLTATDITRVKTDDSELLTRVKQIGVPLIHKNTIQGKAGEIFSGTFTSVVPIKLKDGKKVVLKINRLLKYLPTIDRMKRAKELSEPYILHKDKVVVPNIRIEKSYIARKTGDELKDVEQALLKMEKFSEYKKSIYDKLSKHLVKYLPKLYGFEIVDAPRRELEKLRNKSDLSEEDYANIPEHEIALMEIWEEVDSSSFSSNKFAKLSEHFSDPVFIHSMPIFATNLLRVFRDDGLMVDICDGDGIRSRNNDDSKSNIMKVSDVVLLLASGRQSTIAYPRNVSYANGKILFYDIYPVDLVQDFSEDQELIDDLIMCLTKNDFGGIRKMFFDNNISDDDPFNVILRYLAFLKYLGADFDAVY